MNLTSFNFFEIADSMADQQSMSTHRASPSSGTSQQPSHSPPVARRGSKSSSKKEMILLPSDFRPSPYSVYCGRGKGFYNAVGNRRLRVTVMSFMKEYLEAEGIPTERSRIISRVKDIHKQCCPVGAFIKFEDGRYYELSDKAAREKCSALFRDCVQAQTKGKHSKKAKNQKRGSTKSIAGETEGPQDTKVAAIRRPSLDTDSVSSASMGSFYDVDTEQAVSIEDVQMPLSLNGLDEFLKQSPSS
ncbi:expressed unknown protein [Seminavis robusta]|uniref:DUF6824 domain-containing protein n=1 Tax=Seminavis robusta TaxID=568900 RepID=A0A9N8DDQ5_9STRA|nr:expressed unknown protein [Seminavis robusta]|eukprot:Sro100_g051140.1 n/a (245) ;mRNA; r:17397-18131